MELAELTVRGFTEEIASASPAPGGGSAAALAGAVGAALTAMVSGLTLGRKKYEAVQELALRAQAQADALRKRLLAAMEQDTQAFLQVSAAYAMPKQTPEEKQARSSAIEQGLKACTQPPLAVMQLCAEGLELLESLLGKTNATATQRLWRRLPQPPRRDAGRVAERVHQYRLPLHRRRVCRRCARSGAKAARCRPSARRPLLRGDAGRVQ